MPDDEFYKHMVQCTLYKFMLNSSLLCIRLCARVLQLCSDALQQSTKCFLLWQVRNLNLGCRVYEYQKLFDTPEVEHFRQCDKYHDGL